MTSSKRRPPSVVPLIGVNRRSRLPLHRQIYDCYRSAILQGTLRPGQLVPSTRALAVELQVSRMPVLTAYAQLLAEGYIESRVGVGTLISESLAQRSTRPPSRAPSAGASAAPRRVRAPATYRPFRPPWIKGNTAFVVGQVGLEQFPVRRWTSLLLRNAREGHAVRTYGDLMGSMELREAVADYLRSSRAVNCEAGQIMIVNGSQHGVDVTARALLDAGSPAWVEDPGYQLSRDALGMAGCRLFPVPVDGEGIQVREGIEKCRNARAAFVTPSHQFPLGMTMSLARRLELLDWAATAGSWIIEDDYDSEFRYDSNPISSLQGLDTNGRVLYIGTFSKVLFPSLRLGYVVIPPDLVARFMAVRRASDLGSSELEQRVLADFLREGHFARHIRKMRILYRERRSALVAAIEREFGDAGEIVGAEAGLHLVLLPRRLRNDVAVSMAAAQERLWLWPLSPSYSSRHQRQGFILGFGNVSQEQVPRAVKQLADLMRRLRSAA